MPHFRTILTDHFDFEFSAERDHEDHTAAAGGGSETGKDLILLDVGPLSASDGGDLAPAADDFLF